MKQTPLIVGAVCASGTIALAQGTVQLRIVQVDNSGNPAGIVNDTGSIPATIGSAFEEVFYLQARQMGDPSASGISAFDVVLRASDDGIFMAGDLSFLEQGVDFPGSDTTPSGDNGMFENFRATIQDDNSNLGNGGNGNGDVAQVPTREELSLLPLDLTQGGRGTPAGEWVNVYKFKFTTTVPMEDVVLSATGGSAGYWNNAGALVQPAEVEDASFTLVIPTPATGVLFGLGVLAAARRRR